MSTAQALELRQSVYRFLIIYHQSFEVCFGSFEDKLKGVFTALQPWPTDLEERMWESGGAVIVRELIGDEKILETVHITTPGL